MFTKLTFYTSGMASNEPYDKCFKFLGDLTTHDWIAVGQKLGLNTDDLKSAHTKRQIIHHVYQRNKDWFDSWNIELGKIFFYKFDKANQAGDSVTLMNTSFDSPADEDSYVHKPAVERNFLNAEMLKSIFENEDRSFPVSKQHEPSRSDSADFETGHSHTTPTLTVKPKSHLFMQKLKYDPDTEINRFLSCVESYAKANSITDDSKIVSITVSCLNQSDEGALAVNIVSAADMQSWSTFKAKIIQILGHTADFYKSKFKSFQRLDMKLGLALSTLTQYFMRGWGISDRSLYPIEQEIIMERFIESCDKPLSVMLKAEKTKLTLETVLSRASELEMCFAAETVNSIDNPQSTNEIIDALKKSHQDFMDLQKEFRQELSKLSSRDRPKRRPNPEVFRKLGGLCSYYVKNLDCPRSDCKYRHSGPVSQEQQDCVKNLPSK